MGLTIRRARPSDAERLKEIYRMSFQSRAAPNFNLFISDNSFLVLVAELDGQVVGFLLAKEEGKCAHILLMAVHPSFRRRGVGKTLIAEAIREFKRRGCEKAFLEVSTSNLLALRLYEKMGFTIKDLRFNVLRDEEGVLDDVYVMERKLS